jgi:hypothetical protein
MSSDKSNDRQVAKPNIPKKKTNSRKLGDLATPQNSLVLLLTSFGNISSMQLSKTVITQVTSIGDYVKVRSVDANDNSFCTERVLHPGYLLV